MFLVLINSPSASRQGRLLAIRPSANAAAATSASGTSSSRGQMASVRETVYKTGLTCAVPRLLVLGVLSICCPSSSGSRLRIGAGGSDYGPCREASRTTATVGRLRRGNL